jgi:hypothetical protein
MILAEISTALYVLAAVLTGIAGIITAYASVVKARKEGSENCEDHLRQARAEAEEYTTEVHQWRMRYPGIDPRHE